MLLFLLGLTLGAIFGFDFRKILGRIKGKKDKPDNPTPDH